MMRDWRRLYRLRGFTPFGMLLVVLLAVLLAADRVTERWSAAVQRRDDIERQLAAMHATLGRSRQIDAALSAARARAAAVSGRTVTAPDARTAGQRLAQAAEKWLLSMGATGKAAKALDGGARAPSGTASAEVAVRVMPKQLLRILGGWQQAPQAMRLVRLEVAVDNPDAPAALDAILQVEGVFQRSETVSGSGAPLDARPGSRPGAQPRSQTSLQAGPGTGSKPTGADAALPAGPRSAKTQDAR